MALVGLPSKRYASAMQRALAAAQTVPLAADVERNLEQHLQLVQAAATEGVGLLVFPELSLTGYELARGPELAFTPDDHRIDPLVAAAREYGMHLVAGAPVRDGGRLLMAAFIVSPDGATDVYYKRHLAAFRPEDAADGRIPPPEDRFFEAGDRDPLIHVDGRTAAVSICADSLHPAHHAAAAERGANLYLSSQFGIPAHVRFKIAVLKQAAVTHGFTIVLSNYGGPTGGLPAGGCSGLWSQHGERIVRLESEGLGLAIAYQEGPTWHGHALML